MTDELISGSLPAVRNARRNERGRQWLSELPGIIDELRRRWALTVERPYAGGTCSWAAPVTRADGSAAVLKIAPPDPDTDGESTALALWSGAGSVRLYCDDRQLRALLVERCEPGTPLRAMTRSSASWRVAYCVRILDELWSAAPDSSVDLRQLADVAKGWADEVEVHMERWKPDLDPGLVANCAALLRELPASARRSVVLHGDLNPGNVLSAQRQPLLAIDPKPMLGDPAYDLWPLIEQIDDPFAHVDPVRELRRRFTMVAQLAGEEVERVEAWALVRRVDTALWAIDRGLSGATADVAKAHTLAKACRC